MKPVKFCRQTARIFQFSQGAKFSIVGTTHRATTFNLVKSFFLILALSVASPIVAQTCTSIGPVTSKDTIYQLLTDRFYNGDTRNDVPAGFDAALFDGSGKDLKLYEGGDWAGLSQHISYLKDMGVTAVWISAPYSNRDTEIDDYLADGQVNRWTSYHGYHVHDYFVTNRHFGSMAEFDSLCKALHRNGIKLIIDFVANHTSRRNNPTLPSSPAEDGKLWEPNKNSKGEYMFDSRGEPVVVNGKFETLLADPNAGSSWFHQFGDRGSDASPFGFRYKEHGSLADFSHENSEVVAYLEKAALFWKAKGIDGIRHDATRHMNPAFVKGLRDTIDSSAGGPISQFGEFFIARPDPLYDEYRSFPDRTGVNNLDFEYFGAATHAFGDFSETMADFGKMMLQTQSDYGAPNQAVPFLENHDVTRFRNIQSNDKTYHAALATLLTSRGIPIVYYGSEQYLSGDGRGYFQTAVAASEDTTAFKIIAKLSALRRKNDAIPFGTTSVIYSTNDVLVFQRKFYDKQVIVATNREPTTPYVVPAMDTSLPAGVYPDVLSGLLSCGSATVRRVGSKTQISTFVLAGGQTCVWSYNPSLGTVLPRLGDIMPTMGRAGNIIHIFGRGLGGKVTVRFGSAPAVVVSNTDEHIVVTAPPGVTGPTSVTVTKDDGTSNGLFYTMLSGKQNQVIFHADVPLKPQENVYIVGDIAELGGWDPNKATEAMLGPHAPSRFLPVSVPQNTRFEFKFIKKDANNRVAWEVGEAHVFTSAPGPSAVIDTTTYHPVFH
ncbi:alpha-amylase family glycosyl hydrolase [Dyella sp. GSA-30]|uniref:alpha-amylase family glycosyl hydrolase n=1 Tax=Dyella sp. GSA-30 TaxID=2994496 RepID=UPI002493A5F7|nr:alpha-amylase family glycosyl hydrolase [Dyella sp. GSA-30]BDU21620.1 putative cyclomaltodextrin glucanotransferase [Dyella sp. GSA-30]